MSNVEFAPLLFTQIVCNKVKGRISKQVFQESKARQNFRKTNISYLLIRTLTKRRIKIMTNAQNIIYFHTVYIVVFFSYTYQILYFVRFFSTAIVLSSRQFTVTKALLFKK